ncbi:hypothetical protein HYX19_03070 [Candidatus Woesearchaeota archaeon]|nr:hypothetical protein [Candidatus Woesearchaeota archaeon]
MKKGASHVDWAISMGIFLVYIIGLIIFLRPGVQPILNGDTLINLVQNNLDNETYLKVGKAPLLINLTNAAAGKYSIHINKGFPYDWAKENVSIINRYGDHLPTYIRSSTCDVNGCDLIFESEIERYTINQFVILHSSAFYPNSSAGSLNASLVVVENYDPILRQGNFTYSIGVNEDTKGIFLPSLSAFVNSYNSLSSYQELKNKWKFPDTNAFTVYLCNDKYTWDYCYSNISQGPFDGATLDFKAMLYNLTAPSKDVNVFAKEYKSWVINRKGERILIRILIRIW